MLAPLKIMQKNIFPMVREGFVLRSLIYLFRAMLAPLKIMQKTFSDGQGGFVLRSLNYLSHNIYVLGLLFSSLRMPQQNSTKMDFLSGLCHWNGR